MGDPRSRKFSDRIIHLGAVGRLNRFACAECGEIMDVNLARVRQLTHRCTHNIDDMQSVEIIVPLELLQKKKKKVQKYPTRFVPIAERELVFRIQQKLKDQYATDKSR
jgi:hypothetical protein